MLGLNRGEEVYPMPDLPETACLVVVAGHGVSTPQAFRDWDQRLDADAGENAATGEGNSLFAAASDRLVQLSRTLAVALAGYGTSGVSGDGSDSQGDLAGDSTPRACPHRDRKRL